jgi:hypothetical protein
MSDEVIHSPFATRWLTHGLLALLLLLLVAAVASANVPHWERVDLVEKGNWRDPGGLGSELRFDQTNDGERLVLLGYASPNDLRVVDRNVDTLAVLEPPGEDPVIEGVRWSDTGEWVCAWGMADGIDHDLLWIWNSTTYEPSDWLFENHTTPLADLDSILFMGGDEIMALAGRDANGTSLVILVETSTGDIRREVPWDDNATVVQLGTDTMRVVCIDERGTVSTISGFDWTEFEDLGGHDAEPSSDSLGLRTNQPWIVGYHDGSAAFWGGNPLVHERSAYLDEGPIQAITWVRTGSEGQNYYLVGTPSATRGSVLRAYYYDTTTEPDVPTSDSMGFPNPMTSMAGDAKVNGQAWIAFDDGSLSLVNVSIIPDLPPVITIETPIANKMYREDFTATGTVTDDHDNIQYVRVIIQGGEGFNATVTGDRWTYEVNITDVGTGVYTFIVVTSDGVHEASNSSSLQLPWVESEDDVLSGNQKLAIVIVVALAIFLSWRYVKGRGAVKAPDGHS